MCACVLKLVIVEWKSGRVRLVLGRRGVLVHSTSEQRTLRNLDFALHTFQQHIVFLSCLYHVHRNPTTATGYLLFQDN